MIPYVEVEVYFPLTSALYDELHAPATLAPGNRCTAGRASTKIGLGSVERDIFCRFLEIET